ncbi:hypothetical protein BGZ91_001353, partial [Linnemannia elongata]
MPPNGTVGLAGGLFPDKRFLVTSNSANNLFNFNVYNVHAMPDAAWIAQPQSQSFVGFSGPVLATNVDRGTVYMYLRDKNDNSNSSTGRFHVFTPADPNSLKENGTISIPVGFAPTAASWSIATNSLLMTYIQDGNASLQVGEVPLDNTNFRIVDVNGFHPSSRT